MTQQFSCLPIDRHSNSILSPPFMAHSCVRERDIPNCAVSLSGFQLEEVKT